jgi:hypothetical protein
MINNGGDSSSVIRISIGNIGIVLNVESEALADRIRPAYQDFSGEADEKIWIEITTSVSKLRNSPENPRLVFNEGSIQFDASQLEGSINYLTGYGRLTVSPDSPGSAVEYALRIVIAILAFKAGGFLFHGAGILHRGSGYLFFGPSESGKTTVAKLSVGDVILNDDLVLLSKEDGHWIIRATPFTNPGQVKPTYSGAPLSAMFRLVKDQIVYLESMSRGQALAEFVANIPVLTGITEFAEDLLIQSENLIKDIPLYRLHFTLDKSFWKLVDSVL